MARNRYIPLLLALTLILPLVPAATPADVPPVAVIARTSEGFATIQEALDAAAVGDTVTVLMSSATPAAAYNEALTIATNGVTLCATVAHGVCAATSAPARFELSASTWGTPPVAWQGEAILVNAAGSTSYYATSQQPGAPKLYVSDINALSFAFLLSSGSCTGGGTRFQFGLDTNGDGVKDKTIFAYPSAPCSAGEWVVSDVIASGTWGLGSIGGPSSGASKAQADALSAGFPVITANLIFDGAPTGTVGWFDNQQINGAFLREQVDTTCPDANSPTCVTVSAQAATILTNDDAVPTITIDGASVTVQGFTIRNPDESSATHQVYAIRANAAGVKILGNDIDGNGPRPVPSTSQSPEFGVIVKGDGFTIADNSITDWAHTGLYVSAGNGLVADNLISRNRANSIYLEDGGAPVSIVRNDLRTAQQSNIRVDSRPFELHENFLGLAPATLSFYTAATPLVDAQRNDWGAYSREDIEATIQRDSPGHEVDVSCYLDAVGVPVCPASPDFTYALTGPQWNDAVQFTDASTAGGNAIASYAWDFADGSATSAAASPSHVFAHSGTFPVTLTVTDSEGFAASVTKTVGIANAAPVLAAVASATTAEGSPVSFTLSATDVDGDAISYSGQSLPAGANVNPTTGVFSWTPSFAQAGSYPITFRASDGDLYSEQTATIDVTNVDVAPVLTAIADRTIFEGAAFTVPLAATDADGDAIVLTATGVPSWATFASTAGAGSVAGQPLIGDRGNYVVTITATAGAVSVSDTFTLKVVAVAAMQLVRVDAANLHASPGEAVVLTATLTNGGPATDTFTFGVAASRAWGRVVPASVTLASGESATVSVTLTAPSASERSTITWTATSAANPTVFRSASWSVDVPLILSVEMNTTTVVDGVSGVATAKWLNGSPAANIAIRVVQSPDGFANFASEVTGVTNAAGEFAFSFGDDIGAAFPGEHTLAVIHPAVFSSSFLTSYEATIV